MIYLYYRASIDQMILCNTEPSQEWKDITKLPDHQCELYLPTEKIEFHRANLTLVPKGKEQSLVSYALRINQCDIDEE